MARKNITPKTPKAAQTWIDRTFGKGQFDFDRFDENGVIVMKPHDVAEDMTEQDWHEFYEDAGETCRCGNCITARIAAGTWDEEDQALRPELKHFAVPTAG